MRKNNIEQAYKIKKDTKGAKMTGFEADKV